MTLRIFAAAALAATTSLHAAPALAQGSVEYFTRSHAASLPQLLSQDDRAYYGSLFEAIDSQNWDRVEVMLASRDDGPLHGAALAT